MMRGVGQGDPFSLVLFVAVMEFVCCRLLQRWDARARGTVIGSSDARCLLTHLLYTDDMTMFAKSQTTLARMSEDLRAELVLVGLRLNVSNCVVQSKATNVNAMRGLRVGIDTFLMVPEREGFNVLGGQWCLCGGTCLCMAKLLPTLANAWKHINPDFSTFAALGPFCWQCDPLGLL